MTTPTAADRLYAALLHVYPRAFRERFGDEMCALFHDRRVIATATADRRARLTFWTRTAADLLRHAAAEHLQQARERRRPVRAFFRAEDPVPRSPLTAPPPFPWPASRKDRLMMSLASDLRYAARTLRRQPAFTIIAAITLALGIGANATIFSIVNAVLFKAMNYPDAERIMAVRETNPAGQPDAVSFPNLRDFRDDAKTLESAGVFTGQTVNLTGREQPDRIRGGFVSAGFFDTFGARPHLGRLFTPEDDRDNAPEVVVLQYAAWQARYAGRANVIGETLILNNVPHVIVGIAQAGFTVPIDDTEIWLPARDYASTVNSDRGNLMFFGVGKLRAGVTVTQAQDDLARVAARLARDFPNANAGRGVRVEPFQALLVADTRPALLAVFAAVDCVLLIACVNLANLVLARGVGRSRELSVRAALGASRWRLVRLLLLESLLLALIGGALGFALAYLGLMIVMQFAPAAELIPRRDEIGIDAHVLLFTFAMSVITGLLCGLVPALRISRGGAQEALREGSRSGERRETAWTRHALVVCDIALSLTLLVGAGLFTRTLISLLAQSPGFKTDHVFSLEYRLPRNKYTDAASQWAFHQQVVERVRHVPGVTQAALIRGLSFSGNGGTVGFALPGATSGTDQSKMRQAVFNTITPEYLQTMGIPLFAGRTCAEQDTPSAPGAALVNRYLANQLWPSESPLGKSLRLDDGSTVTIVGVSGSTKQWSLAEPERPQIYTCYSQRPGIFATLVARTSIEPLNVSNAVKEAIWSVDRDQPVWKLRSMDFLLDRVVSPVRFVMWLMVGTAALALLLALVGIYGVMSYNVTRQTREIGLRLALGAEPRDIIHLIVGRGFWLTVLGLACGLAGARWMASFISTQLFGVTATDVTTYASVALLLGLVSLAACYLPARRAMRVNPIIALKTD